MSTFLKKLTEKHQIFIDSLGLHVVAENFSPEFGGSACLIYSNGQVSIKVTKSRDGLIYECAAGDWQNAEWYSVDIIQNYLMNNSEYKTYKNSNQFSYIMENFTQISKIFSLPVDNLIPNKLRKLELSRSKKLFG